MTDRLTIIGGGTGSFNLLSGLRGFVDLEIRSIVTMMDSGGDSGELRDAFGVLPPGDLRRCLVALSEESSLLRDLFSFRFQEAPLENRNFGNLFFLALTRTLGSERDAVEALSRLLKIRGEVIPVTWEHSQLVATLEDGSEIHGEAAIDRRSREDLAAACVPIREIALSPPATANPDALDAIAKSDVVVLAPGDVFTSIIPNLLVEGIREALRAVPLIQVVNLMTKRGETDGWSAARHVERISAISGRAPDAIVYSPTPPDDPRLASYREAGATPVVDDLARLEAEGLRVVRADLESPLSLIHHDPRRTAETLVGLMRELR